MGEGATRLFDEASQLSLERFRLEPRRQKEKRRAELFPLTDNKGVFDGDNGDCDDLPEGDPAVAADWGTMSDADYDIYDCLVPTYMPAMVCDPVNGEDCDDPDAYDSAYEVIQDEDSGRISVKAAGEVNGDIIVTR